MKPRLTILLIFCICTQAFAQEPWEEEGGIDEKQIIIEKDKEIKLPEASRPYSKVETRTSDKKYAIKPYNFRKFDFSYVPVRTGIRVLKIKEEPLDKLYSNYVRAGFGNYVTPLLEVFLSNKRSQKYNYGLHFDHFSSLRGPVDGRNSGSGNTDVTAFGKVFGKTVTFSGDLYYKNQVNHFYGYSPSLEVDRDSIKHSFNRFGLNLGVENNDASDQLGYRINMDLGQVSDNFEASEFNFDLGIDLNYAISTSSSVQLQTDLMFSNYKDAGESLNRNLFRILPQYTFNYSNFLIRAGVNVVYENDTLADKNDLHVYPVASVTYPVEGAIQFTAGIRGDIDRLSFDELSRVNPWLGPQAPIFNTSRDFEVYGKVDAKIGESFVAKAFVGFATLDNLYFLVNSESDSTRFEPLYDDGNTERLQIGGEVRYQLRDDFELSSSLNFFTYNTDTLEEAWHRPTFMFSIAGSYNLYDKIRISTGFELMSGIKARDPVDFREIKLSALPDWNAEVEYIFSSRASAFVRLDNILSNKYERYLNYPSRGLMVLGGVAFSF